MTSPISRTIALNDTRDVLYARKAAAEAMAAIGASVIRQTRFATAISEITRNALIYGQGGYITIQTVGTGSKARVIAECVDRGPGIADIDRALTDGFSTGRSLGKGLGGAKRLADAFRITSSAEAGTTVRLEGWMR